MFPLSLFHKIVVLNRTDGEVVQSVILPQRSRAENARVRKGHKEAGGSFAEAGVEGTVEMRIANNISGRPEHTNK